MAPTHKCAQIIYLEVKMHASSICMDLITMGYMCSPKAMTANIPICSRIISFISMRILAIMFQVL